MVFLTSRSTSKHIFFALGVDRTARNAVKARVSTSESRKLHPSQCHAGLESVYVSMLHKSSITSLARCQANVEFATEVCLSLFDGSEILASGTKGKLCNM